MIICSLLPVDNCLVSWLTSLFDTWEKEPIWQMTRKNNIYWMKMYVYSIQVNYLLNSYELLLSCRQSNKWLFSTWEIWKSVSQFRPSSDSLVTAATAGSMNLPLDAIKIVQCRNHSWFSRSSMSRKPSANHVRIVTHSLDVDVDLKRASSFPRNVIPVTRHVSNDFS